MRLQAAVGTYLMQLATFPLQREVAPSSLICLEKQFPIEVYLCISPERILGFESWVWMASLTFSSGAVMVLETAPEIPPAARLISGLTFYWSDMVVFF
tara:strand:+ start:535 stop:828 length:294 start_codon:yes stop_codon:yes gene_type:complete